LFFHTDQLSRHVFIKHASNAISVHYVVSESVAGCISKPSVLPI